MASNNIKGLTIEIGGDTTKLGKALEGVNKKSVDLSKELGQINKLLKFDSKNVELLAQKQKVLSDAITNTKDRLDTLKKAEKQVQEQFERGEVSEEQVRALQREIIETTQRIEKYEQAAKEAADAMDNLGKDTKDLKDDTDKAEKGSEEAADAMDEMADSADEAGDASDSLGKKLGSLAKGGLQLLVAGVTAAVGALIGSAEASREYRTEMGKLDTAFTSSGHSSQAATKTYKELQGILGETDQAVEAANHLAKLADNEEDLQKWTNIATGVYATFGASLPIEGLTEAANETAKTGALTGSLADALNWAGVSEDEFQVKLDACTTEQERQALIAETLNGLYSDAADKYRETNAEIIRANQANEEWAASMAEVGAAVEPILTDIKLLGASLLADLLPGITQVTEGFRGMLNGDEGAAADVGAALSGIFEHLFSTVTNLLPQVAEMAVSLITTLATSLLAQLPTLMRTLMQLFTQAIYSVATALPDLMLSLTDALLGVLLNFGAYLPDIVAAITEVVYSLTAYLPDVIDLLVDNIPDLVTEIVSALSLMLPELMLMVSMLIESIGEALPELASGLVEGIKQLAESLLELLPQLLPQLLELITSLINMLVEQIPVLLPILVNLISSLVTMLVEMLPTLLPQIVSLVISVVNLLAEQLPLLIPTLVTALIQIFTLLVEQLPVIIPMLIDAAITIVMALIEALPDILIALTEALPEILQAVWDAIVMIFTELPAWFGQLFQGALDIIVAVFGVIVEWAEGIWEDITEIWFEVTEWFSELFTNAWNGITEAWSGVTTFFSGLWEGIKNAFSNVTTWFADIFGEAWESVLGVFSAAGEVFSGIKDGILSVFTTVVNGIIRGLNEVVKLPFEGLNGILDTLQNLSFLKITPFSWLTWRAPVPQIPELAKGGVLERGQMALLEGDGAEAVVPLEKNTEWIQRVASEFVAQVRNVAGADLLDEQKRSRPEPPDDNGGLFDKLEKILAVLEAGQILTIDGEALVGATADRTDSALGQRRELVARGAV